LGTILNLDKSNFVGIIDYGAGNIFSVETILQRLGYTYKRSSDPTELEPAKYLIIPGVGSFSTAMEKLHTLNLVSFIHEAAKNRDVRILGICLGMQLLLSEGLEGGQIKGLNLISGQVKRLAADRHAKVPNIGWDDVTTSAKLSPILDGLCLGQTFYFNHSYHSCINEDIDMAYTLHGRNKFVAAFQKQTIVGVQFHPEKSQLAGEDFLKNFLNWNNGGEG
jgi:imidazole glycerol-phosphate synthase subunit HisH